jgi:hypothetical protein
MSVWFAFVSIGIWFISKYEITRSLQAAEAGALERGETAPADL